MQKTQLKRSNLHKSAYAAPSAAKIIHFLSWEAFCCLTPFPIAFSEYLILCELPRLSLRLEVGASCFNHYCPADTLRYRQVLHSVHKRWVRPVPDLPYIIYATENPDFSILRPSRLIFMAAFRSRLIVRPQSHTIVRFARFFISG